MPDLTALPGGQLLSDLVNAVAADALEHRQPVLTRPTLALRAELLRRLRIVDVVAARLNALVDADAVGRSTPAAVAEIEALFRLATGVLPPQP